MTNQGMTSSKVTTASLSTPNVHVQHAHDFPCLYNVSWTLHRLQWPRLASANRTLVNLLTNPRSRAHRARQMQQFLHVDLVGAEADNGFDEKAGRIRKCTWEVLGDGMDGGASDDHGQSEQACGILIRLCYDMAEYSVVLYGPAGILTGTETNTSAERSLAQPPTLLPLFLTKTPITLTKRLVVFLFDNFELQITPFKMPRFFLTEALETYIEIIRRQTTPLSVSARNDLISSVVKDLKLSLSFAVPVAPQLRTLDIDVPSKTLCNLTDAAVAQDIPLLRVLAAHLEDHTGMKIPLSKSDTVTSDVDEDKPLMRVTRIVCNAFALSADGRFKMIEQAHTLAQTQNLRSGMREANTMLLRRLLEESYRIPDRA